jgi:hypothetical protein
MHVGGPSSLAPMLGADGQTLNSRALYPPRHRIAPRISAQLRQETLAPRPVIVCRKGDPATIIFGAPVSRSSAQNPNVSNGAMSSTGMR